MPHLCGLVLHLSKKLSKLNELDPVDGVHFGRQWYQRHWSGRVCLVTGHTSSLGEPSPQALTLLGGVRFIAWRLKRPFLGEYRRISRHLGCRARLGYTPAPETTFKKALCHTCQFGGAVNKYRWFNKLNSADGVHFGRPWYQRHGSGQVCHISGYGSQPRLPSAVDDNHITVCKLFILRIVTWSYYSLKRIIINIISIIIISSSSYLRPYNCVQTNDYSSSSSCRAASTNIPDPLSPLLPIIHRLWQVLRVTSCVLT